MTRVAEVLSTCVSSASQRVGLRLRFEDDGDERNVMKEVTGIVGVLLFRGWFVSYAHICSVGRIRLFVFMDSFFFLSLFFFHRKADS